MPRMPHVITPKEFTRRDLLRLASITIGCGALSKAADAAVLGARGVAMGGGNDRLPKEYRRVVYLETANNAYVNILNGKPVLKFSNTFKFDIDFQFLTVPSSKYYGIGFTSVAQQAFIAQNSNASTGTYTCFGNNASTLTKQIVQDRTARHRVIAKSVNGQLTYAVDSEGNIIKTGTANGFNINRYDLLAITDVGNSFNDAGYQRFFSAIIENDGVAVFEFVPAVRKRDNKPCVFDLVSMTPYFNEGSGEFGWKEKDGTIVNPTT